MEFEFNRGEELIAEISIAYVCIGKATQQPQVIPEQISSILEGQ